jgi:hypothetical protein
MDSHWVLRELLRNLTDKEWSRAVVSALTVATMIFDFPAEFSDGVRGFGFGPPVMGL